MQAVPRLVITLVLFFTAVGCVRRDGRNADCEWPAENSYHAPTPRHLSADAEFAEDLSIRYADTHYGLRTPGFISGEVYEAARNRCMAALFQQVAEEHDVSIQQVASSLGHNRGYIDFAEIVPFVVLYVFAAAAVARVVWKRYPPSENGWQPGIAMALFFSLALAVGGTMMGEVWFWFAEGYRMGNSHMSYRANRLFWVRHRAELFLGAVVIMWLAVAEAARHVQSRNLT